jgi:deazaflavin-dependent oxidoreductase (nitroreductase family)
MRVITDDGLVFTPTSIPEPLKWISHRIVKLASTASETESSVPTKYHPKSGPGVPYIFPDWLDRLQAKFETPVIRRFRRFPTFAIVEHRGRKSGRHYETVVRAYCKGPVLVVLLGHGKTDWAKNVLAAGEAEVRLFRDDVHIVNPRIVPVGATPAGCTGSPGWAPTG